MAIKSFMFLTQTINNVKYKQGMVAQPDFRLNSKTNQYESFEFKRKQDV